MAVKEKALKRLAEKMNAAGIPWAIGGDFLLAQRGLPVAWHGFELYTTPEAAAKADKILTRLGMRTPDEAAAEFACEYHFDGADISLLAAPHYGSCTLNFSADGLAEDIAVFGVPVHCMHLEDWLVLSVLQGRAPLTEALTAYFKQNGVSHPERFDACLNGEVPECVQAALSAVR